MIRPILVTSSVLVLLAVAMPGPGWSSDDKARTEVPDGLSSAAEEPEPWMDLYEEVASRLQALEPRIEVLDW